jgi:hypothetical protein
MKKFWLKLGEGLIGFLKFGERKYLGYAIAAPVLLAGIAIEHQIVPPASVVRDVAIYMFYFLAVAAMIRVYVRYIERV